MSRNHRDRILTERGGSPTVGLTRGELAILILDVDNDLVTAALGQLERRGLVVTSTRTGGFGGLFRYRPSAPAESDQGASFRGR